MKIKLNNKQRKLWKTRCQYCGCPIIECSEKDGVIRIFDTWYKIDKRRINEIKN